MTTNKDLSLVIDFRNWERGLKLFSKLPGLSVQYGIPEFQRSLVIVQHSGMDEGKDFFGKVEAVNSQQPEQRLRLVTNALSSVFIIHFSEHFIRRAVIYYRTEKEGWLAEVGQPAQSFDVPASGQQGQLDLKGTSLSRLIIYLDPTMKPIQRYLLIDRIEFTLQELA